MSTTATVTSTAPLQITIVTDQHELEVAGDLTVTVGADVVPVHYDVKSQTHPVDLSDSGAHAWSVVSDDEGAPVSTIIVQF